MTIRVFSDEDLERLPRLSERLQVPVGELAPTGTRWRMAGLDPKWCIRCSPVVFAQAKDCLAKRGRAAQSPGINAARLGATAREHAEKLGRLAGFTTNREGPRVVGGAGTEVSMAAWPALEQGERP